MVSLASRLSDSGMISNQFSATLQADIIALAKKIYPVFKNESTEEYYGNIYSLVELLGRINTPASLAALKKYLVTDNKYLKQNVAIELIKRNQAVPATVMNGLAADISTRLYLYDELVRLKKKVLFPVEYLTQQKLAQAELYTVCEEQDMTDVKINLVMKKTLQYESKEYVFYIYKVTEGEASYVGISGGYDLAGLQMKPVIQLTGVYTDEEFDPKNIAAIVKKYLEQLHQ